jgi:quercetin dioxygenase-like cupin family protein
MDKLPVDRATCERLMMGTDEVTILASCADTGGALFAVEIRMGPGGGPPVMHRHEPGEIYHVLEGEFTFYTATATDDAASDDAASDDAAADKGVRRATAVAGDVVPLAGGVAHTVRNESDKDAVAFVVHAPGAPMEQFSRSVAAMDGPRDMAAVLEVAARSGIELLGPVP